MITPDRAMTDQGQVGPDWVHLTPDEARTMVADAARLYFESRRARVDSFVDRHFSLAGSLALHRKALGWDLLKVPANILLAISNVALQLSAWGAHAAGASQTATALRRRRLLLETAVGQEIEWLIMTELLKLPYKIEGRISSRNALAEAILSSPQVQAAVLNVADRIGSSAEDPVFRKRLEEALATYPTQEQLRPRSRRR
jgi:hypothetical protein